MLQTGSADRASATPALEKLPLPERTAEIASRTVEYSRFVRYAKIALPTTAAGLFMLIVLFSALHKSVSDGTGTINIKDLVKNGQVEMSNPALTYTDDESRAFYVNANRAIQTGEKDIWHLEGIRGRMSPPQGRGFKLTSDTGAIDAAKKLLDLQGRVLVVSDEGYTFNARSAHVDMDKNRVTSEEPVKAHGGATHIEADRFEMWDKGNKLLFEGHVHFVSASTKRLIPPAPEEAANQGAEGTRGP